MKTKLFIAGLIAVSLLASGLGCKQSGEARNYKPVTLQYWGVFESSEDIEKLTRSYTQRHPKITIQYRRLRENEYRQKMLEAWALGQGPDLFIIPNTQIREFLKFTEPMPATMRAPVQYEKGTIKKEIIDEIRTYTGYNPKQVRDSFLDIVYEDVVINNKIYGLPYSVDTLSVFYNRELLKNNNIALPAKTWQELAAQASLISRADSEDRIVQSTVALGATNNIPTVLDIVSTLMMQLNITMGDAGGPAFHTNPESIDAIQFFLSFAQKGLKNYSWNKDMPQALDAFSSGKLAYFIGYPYNAPIIRSTNPKLDFDVIPMFQPEGTQGASVPTYASYWVTVVTKPKSSETKQKAELAWQYLLESTNANNVKAFINNPGNPRTTALRALVEEQKNDLILGPFAHNLLSAQSWYKGYDFGLAKKYFLDMINNIENANRQNLQPQTFLAAGVNLIGQTYQPPPE